MTGVQSRPQDLRVVLLGLDGAGKTTVARAVVRSLQQQGQAAYLYRNPGGRRTLNRWAAPYAASAEALVGSRLLDAVETSLRIGSVLRSALSARQQIQKGSVVIFDRHLWCQLALRKVRGLRAGVVLPWLLRVLPQPDLVVYLEVDPGVAVERISSRATDEETLEFLTELDAAYRSLSEFPRFVAIDGNGSSEEAAAAMLALVDRRRSRIVQP